MASIIFRLCFYCCFICLYKVHGQELISVDKDARQSSTFKVYTAGRAVDGGSVNKCYVGQGSVACTRAEYQPWWMIDLGAMHQIQDIRITARMGPQADKYVGFYVVLVGNRTTSSGGITGFLQCAKSPNELQNGRSHLISCKIFTRYVAIKRLTVGSRKNLCLCEVSVIGYKVCSNGTYGKDCSKSCDGCTYGLCDINTGACIRGCKPGRMGRMCDLNCMPGYYGAGCRYSCPMNCDHVCETTTGACRCRSGFTGTKCDRPCLRGFYGQNCQETCPERCYLNICDYVSGTCRRCEKGYRGSQCNMTCESGKFGFGCSQSCPPSCATYCNRLTGICPARITTASLTTMSTSHLISTSVGRTRKGTTTVLNPTSVREVVTKRPDPTVSSTEADAATADAQSEKGGTPYIAIIIPLFVVILGLGTAGIIFYMMRKNNPQNNKLGRPGQMFGDMPGANGFGNMSLQNYKPGTKTSYPWTMETVTETVEENDYDSDDSIPMEHFNPDVLTPTRGAPETDMAISEIQMDEFAPRYAPKVTESTKSINEALQKQETEVDHSIRVADLPDRVKHIIGGTVIEDIFSNISIGQKPQSKVGSHKNCLIKNRDEDIIAYDHSRVKLLVPDGQFLGEDYINANYIDGFEKKKKYIAAQGPMESTVEDFVRMLWEQDVAVVVMVTELEEDGESQSVQYWPDKVEGAGSSRYGDISVELIKEEIFLHHVFRTLMICRDDVYKEIQVCQFTSWPTWCPPLHSPALLAFREEVIIKCMMAPEKAGPIVVHCDRGVDRTGTYIALDYLLEQASSTGRVNLVGCVTALKRNRPEMVESLHHFLFLHETLLETLHCGKTCLTVSEYDSFIEELSESTDDGDTFLLQKQYDVLKIMNPSFTDNDFKEALSHVNVVKNRSRDIIAAESRRPYLITHIPDGTNYINAVCVNSLLRESAYIVTQSPMNNTLVDFWCLINDYDVSTVICLNDFDQDSFPRYWKYYGKGSDSANDSETESSVDPDHNENVLKLAPFEVTTCSEDSYDNEAGVGYTIRTFSLCQAKSESKTIKQFHLHGWSHDLMCPMNSDSILALIKEAQQWQMETGSHMTVVHCQDGAHASGVFCCLSSVCTQIDTEQEVDVFHTAKQVRRSRPQFIQNLEQYQFLYDAAHDYINTYSNLAGLTSGAFSVGRW